MSFKQIELKNLYRSNNSNILKDFFNPLLKHSIYYKRAVGFFNASSFRDNYEGLIDIASKGGKIEFVVSPRITEEDLLAIKKGYEDRQRVVKTIFDRDLEEFESTATKKELGLLAVLIKHNILDIKVAIVDRSTSIGMYHEKIGVLTDEFDNSVSFIGSINESTTAYNDNFESFVVFNSWDDLDRHSDIVQSFDDLWLDNTEMIKVFEMKEAIEKKIIQYEKYSDYDVIFKDNSRRLILKEKTPALIENKIELYDYQKEAITNWFNMKCKGVFNMATGTGKTITALVAIQKLNEALENKLITIVIVPYIHLVEQWIEEAKMFNMSFIAGYSGARGGNYKLTLEEKITSYNFRRSEGFNFITTNASYRTKDVQNLISQIKGNVLIVADEAHNLGSSQLNKLLHDNFKYRLALSATFERHMDEEGTKAIRNYFGETAIEYTLEKAIIEGKLTPYYYYPIIVSLTEEERSEYLRLTKLMGGQIKEDIFGEIKITERGKILALRRARLIAGAENKIPILRKVMKEKYKDKSNMLVYCGTSKISGEQEEEVRQIDEVINILGNELFMKVERFTSLEDINEREIIKKRFESGDDLQALVAIKCLDEGVNIPSIKTAFLLASTTNPKEYIQRRGRVLRLYPGKEYSEIYDFITIPMDFDDIKYYSHDQLKSFGALLNNEIARLNEFSRLAINSSYGYSIILKINREFELNRFESIVIESIEWEE